MADRTVVLVTHTGKPTNIDACVAAARQLKDAGIAVKVLASPGAPEKEFYAHEGIAGLPIYDRTIPASEASAELIIVLGGDGTFLRAADVAHAHNIPVLGINLGHVGFLAEWEQDSLALAIDRVIEKNYRVDTRMSLDVRAYGPDDELIASGWALNEVSIEHTNRRGVLDATVAVDGHPVSSFGCDGVLVSTPTGSTAYAFSAGGPVMWPELEAILVVPNNAHALFAKPLVVSPQSVVTVEVDPPSGESIAVMDGFRDIDLPGGSRVEIVHGLRPVRWVRLDRSTFTDRLVTKFRLPISGWRGPKERPHT